MSEPTRVALAACVEEMNSKYPRPGIPRLELSAPYDLTDVSGNWPNSGVPGVYVFLKDDSVLYIGKSDGGLGYRLIAHISADATQRDDKARDATHLITIGIPEENYFEAAAIESFLIGRLNPPRNKAGRRMNK